MCQITFCLLSYLLDPIPYLEINTNIYIWLYQKCANSALCLCLNSPNHFRQWILFNFMRITTIKNDHYLVFTMSKQNQSLYSIQDLNANMVEYQISFLTWKYIHCTHAYEHRKKNIRLRLLENVICYTPLKSIASAYSTNVIYMRYEWMQMS